MSNSGGKITTYMSIVTECKPNMLVIFSQTLSVIQTFAIRMAKINTNAVCLLDLLKVNNQWSPLEAEQIKNFSSIISK